MDEIQEVYRLMQVVKAMTGKEVRLVLYSDGSGQIEHNESQRRFLTLELAKHLLKSLQQNGFMP